jgi:hypothetical protein
MESNDMYSKRAEECMREGKKKLKGIPSHLSNL